MQAFNNIFIFHLSFHGIIDTLVHWDANKAGYTEKLFQYPDPGLNSQMLASIIIVSDRTVRLT